MNIEKWSLKIFSGLVFLSLLTPVWIFSELFFPYITSKAFFFRIAIELALPFYLYLIVVNPQLRPKFKNFLNIAVLVFLLINIVSGLAGVNVIRSLWGNYERMGGAYYLAHLVALYFYVQVLGQAGGTYLKRFLQAFVAVAVFVTLNGLLGKLGGPTLVLDPSLPVRISSTFGNPIFFASYLIIPMFLAAYLGLQENGRTLKVLYWIAAFLQLIGIYFSGTRGAAVGVILGLFISLIAYIVLTKNSRIKKYGLVGVAVIILFAGGLYFNHNKLPRGSTLYRLANLRDSNTEARLIQWKMALAGFKEKPLLGTGPENYYVISDKYYNPEIYKYDPSWFDKPHNFLIEVLVTTGIFGFAAYGFMFVLALYALWRAYKSGLFNLLETCLFFAAGVAYQVQNLFVFDTVSASVAFYAFLGFTAYVWIEGGRADNENEDLAHNKKNWYATGVLIVSLFVVSYIVYVSNILPLWVAKRINFGMVYTNQNAKIAADYFESALSLPFNFDERETASRYSDFSAKILGTDLMGNDPDFVTGQIDKAADYQRKIANKFKNEPLLWMRLGIDEINYAIVHGQDVNNASASIEKAISLAPKRVELLQLRVQLASYSKDWKTVASTSEQIARLNPYRPELIWQLAMSYFLNGQVEEAVKAGDEAIAQGFKFNQLQQFAWYIQYYEDKNDFAKVAPLLEQAIALEPNEIGLYVDLAKVYANLGNYEKARLLAEQVAKSDPSQKATMEAFIKTLK